MISIYGKNIISNAMDSHCHSFCLFDFFSSFAAEKIFPGTLCILCVSDSSVSLAFHFHFQSPFPEAFPFCQKENTGNPRCFRSDLFSAAKKAL